MGNYISPLQDFIAPLQAEAPEYYEWPLANLQVHTYLCDDLPPDEFVTSVRALVIRDDEVLRVQDPTGYHILPGGRREAGESYLETVVREVLEETGWQIDLGSLLGFKHFYRLTPKPAEISYPHPDFAQIIFVATPRRWQPEAREVGGYELGSEFVSLAQLEQTQLTASEHLLLRAALNKRRFP